MQVWPWMFLTQPTTYLVPSAGLITGTSNLTCPKHDSWFHSLGKAILSVFPVSVNYLIQLFRPKANSQPLLLSSFPTSSPLASTAGSTSDALLPLLLPLSPAQTTIITRLLWITGLLQQPSNLFASTPALPNHPLQSIPKRTISKRRVGYAL